MALGMNGYHNLSDFAASAGKARTPSTLSAVNNSLPQERRRPNDPREPENWEKIKYGSTYDSCECYLMRRSTYAGPRSNRGAELTKRRGEMPSERQR